MPKNTTPTANNSNMLVSAIDRCFALLKKTSFNDFLENNEKWFSRVGIFSLYITAVLSLIVSFIIPAKYSAFGWGTSLCTGCAAFFVVLLLQYIAAKSIPCLLSQVKNTPVKISTVAILDITCLLNAVCGVLFCIGGLILAVKLSDFSFFVIGTGATVLCLYWMTMALNPASLNVQIAQSSSAGEEFIALLTFFAKGCLRLLPITFCGSVLTAAFLLCKLMFTEFYYTEDLYDALRDIAVYTLGALLPVVGYISFLCYYFTIDIARAILSIPERLEH